MPNALTRLFTRSAKRLTGQPLTIDDISKVATLRDPETGVRHLAKRQYNSEFWRVYESDGFPPPSDFSVLKGVSLKEAMAKLEEIESDYADRLRGKKSRPYNHFTNVRKMLPEGA